MQQQLRARSATQQAASVIDHDAFDRQLRLLTGPRSLVPVVGTTGASQERKHPATLNRLLDAVVARLPSPVKSPQKVQLPRAPRGSRSTASIACSTCPAHVGMTKSSHRVDATTKSHPLLRGSASVNSGGRARPASAYEGSKQLQRPSSRTYTRSFAPLPAHVKRAVYDLFEGFALSQQQQQSHAAPWLPSSTPPGPSRTYRSTSASVLTGAAVSNASSVNSCQQLSTAVGRYAAPSATTSFMATRKSFEALLKLYYRSATHSELIAMADLVVPEMSALVQGKWVARTKSEHSSEIVQAFRKLDTDGSGGIDIEEFVGAVKESKAPLEEARVRALFAEGDKDKNGVLDLDEFIQLLSKSADLVEAFGDILKIAIERRHRKEEDRLAMFLKHPTICSPSGRKRRPSLFDVRRLEDVELPLEAIINPMSHLKRQPLPPQATS